jgi:hypothetical protein
VEGGAGDKHRREIIGELQAQPTLVFLLPPDGPEAGGDDENKVRDAGGGAAAAAAAERPIRVPRLRIGENNNTGCYGEEEEQEYEEASISIGDEIFIVIDVTEGGGAAAATAAKKAKAKKSDRAAARFGPDLPQPGKPAWKGVRGEADGPKQTTAKGAGDWLSVRMIDLSRAMPALVVCSTVDAKAAAAEARRQRAYDELKRRKLEKRKQQKYKEQEHEEDERVVEEEDEIRWRRRQEQKLWRQRKYVPISKLAGALVRKRRQARMDDERVDDERVSTTTGREYVYIRMPQEDMGWGLRRLHSWAEEAREEAREEDAKQRKANDKTAPRPGPTSARAAAVAAGRRADEPRSLNAVGRERVARGGTTTTTTRGGTAAADPKQAGEEYGRGEEYAAAREELGLKPMGGRPAVATQATALVKAATRPKMREAITNIHEANAAFAGGKAAANAAAAIVSSSAGAGSVRVVEKEGGLVSITLPATPPVQIVQVDTNAVTLAWPWLVDADVDTTTSNSRSSRSKTDSTRVPAVPMLPARMRARGAVQIEWELQIELPTELTQTELAQGGDSQTELAQGGDSGPSAAKPRAGPKAILKAAKAGSRGGAKVGASYRTIYRGGAAATTVRPLAPCTSYTFRLAMTLSVNGAPPPIASGPFTKLSSPSASSVAPFVFEVVQPSGTRYSAASCMTLPPQPPMPILLTIEMDTMGNRLSPLDTMGGRMATLQPKAQKQGQQQKKQGQQQKNREGTAAAAVRVRLFCPRHAHHTYLGDQAKIAKQQKKAADAKAPNQGAGHLKRGAGKGLQGAGDMQRRGKGKGGRRAAGVKGEGNEGAKTSKQSDERARAGLSGAGLSGAKSKGGANARARAKLLGIPPARMLSVLQAKVLREGEGSSSDTEDEEEGGAGEGWVDLYLGNLAEVEVGGLVAGTTIAFRQVLRLGSKAGSTDALEVLRSIPSKVYRLTIPDADIVRSQGGGQRMLLDRRLDAGRAAGCAASVALVAAASASAVATADVVALANKAMADETTVVVDAGTSGGVASSTDVVPEKAAPSMSMADVVLLANAGRDHSNRLQRIARLAGLAQDIMKLANEPADESIDGWVDGPMISVGGQHGGGHRDAGMHQLEGAPFSALSAPFRSEVGCDIPTDSLHAPNAGGGTASAPPLPPPHPPPPLLRPAHQLYPGGSARAQPSPPAPLQPAMGIALHHPAEFV